MVLVIVFLHRFLIIFKTLFEGTKAKATKKKYQGLVNKIQGKQLKNEFKEGYIHKYAKGIKRNDICHVCEDLQIESSDRTAT